MHYEVEDFRDIKDELVPITQAHWEDVALNQDSVALNPDWGVYEYLQEHGNLQIVTARNDEGVMVGYVVYIISPWLHYRDHILADGDVFWLHPDYRKGLTGIKLLRAAEDFLKQYGVDFIINKVKLHKDIGPLFERMGFKPIERVYAKRIS